MKKREAMIRVWGLIWVLLFSMMMLASLASLSALELRPACEKPSGHIPVPSTSTDGEVLIRLSWDSFLALNWPAEQPEERRGVPRAPDDPAVFRDLRGPRVWETWKQSWELFQAEPTPWDSYVVQEPPCEEIVLKGGQRISVNADNWHKEFRPFGTLLNFVNLVKVAEGEGPELSVVPTGPLIDKDGNYVRYEVRFNRQLYDCAAFGRGNGCGIGVRSIKFPAAYSDRPGAISLKASWIDSEGAEDDRYYTRQVLVLEYEARQDGAGFKPICKEERRSLVGLHLVYKNGYLSDRCACDLPANQWIWGTFEWKDNVPICKGPFSPDDGFSYEPKPLKREPFPPPEDRVPVMVCRTSELPSGSSISKDNQSCQCRLSTPWDNYFMVNNQWMVGNGCPTPRSHVANATLETYVQDDSCINCHRFESTAYDHVWTLALDREDRLPSFNFLNTDEE